MGTDKPYLLLRPQFSFLNWVRVDKTSQGSGIPRPWHPPIRHVLFARVTLPHTADSGLALSIPFCAHTQVPPIPVILYGIPRSAARRRSETSHWPGALAPTSRRLGRCTGPPLAASRPPFPPSLRVRSGGPKTWSSHAGHENLAVPRPPAAARQTLPHLQPQVQAGEEVATACPVPAGPPVPGIPGSGGGCWSSVHAWPAPPS